MNAWILFAFVFVFAIDTEIITDGNVPVAGKAFAVVDTTSIYRTQKSDS